MAVIHFSAWPIIERSTSASIKNPDGSAPIWHTTSPMDATRKNVECANLSEAKTAYEAFKAEMQATGKAFEVHASFGRQKARKFNGFDAWSRGAQDSVNAETIPIRG